MFIKLINKYKNQTQPVKAAFWFTVCNTIPKVIGFFIVPVYIRLLSTEQYGMYSVYNSWFAIVSIIAALNLSAGVFNNGMLKFEKSRADYTSALQGLGTVITIALFVVYLVFKNKFNLVFKLPAILVLLMFAQCLFYPAFDFWSARQCFEYRYRLLIAVTVFIAIASPAIAIICIQRTIYKSEALVVGTVGVHLLLCIFFYVYNFSKCNKLFNKMYWRYALKFNLPLIPHYLAGMVLGQSDRVMIDWLVNRSQAGIYSLAYSISLVMNVVIGGVNASFIFHVPGLKPPPLGGQL